MSLTYSIDENFDLAKIETRFQKIFELAIPFLKTRLNLPHTYIVYQYAQLLLKEEGGSAEITLPACILHDVGWSSIPEDRQLTAFGPKMKDEALRRKHEVEGVAIADQILRKLGYDQALIPEIIKIIDGHGQQKRDLPRTQSRRTRISYSGSRLSGSELIVKDFRKIHKVVASFY